MRERRRVVGGEVMGRRRAWAAVFLAAAVGLAHTRAADPPAPDAASATVVDAAGKEVKLSAVRFTLGTRRLAWLADPAATTEEGKKGPLALDLREPHSTTFQNGVVTLVPLGSVEGVTYDADKFTAAVGVKGLPAPVVGTTQYKGFCVLGFEGEAGGVKGKFAGGVVRTGVKSLAFTGAKPLPDRKADGPAWAVKIDHPKAGNPTVAARNLKALYQFPGGAEKLADVLPVRKGDPLALGGPGKPPGFAQLDMLAVDSNRKLAVAEVGGRTVLIPTAEWEGKPATLVGLVGEVDAGWKLFPLHTVLELKPAGK